VTIGSLIVKDALPKDRPSQIIYVRDRVAAIISKHFVVGAVPVIPVLVGVSLKSTKLNFKGELPNFDAIFETNTQAYHFRRLVSTEAKKGGDLSGLYVSNCVTLATRVRCEILVAISKKVSSSSLTCFCQTYLSRPVMTVKPRDSPGPSRVFTFSDAVLEYGAQLSDTDLVAAYRRAGDRFKGTLEKYFVVLKDRSTPATGANATRSSAKRPRDSAGGNFRGKKSR